METSKKTRVSNEQLLGAILGLTEAIKGTMVKPAQDKQDQSPAPIRFAMSTATAGRLIAHLPQATEIPKGINVEWLGGLEKKAARWATEKECTEPVFVYFVVNSFGQHKPLFGRASSKVSQNAVSLYKKVN
jgi:hypothetical protein